MGLICIGSTISIVIMPQMEYSGWTFFEHYLTKLAHSMDFGFFPFFFLYSISLSMSLPLYFALAPSLPLRISSFAVCILLLEIVLNLSDTLNMWKMLNIGSRGKSIVVVVVVVIVKCRSIFGQNIESTSSYLAHRSISIAWCFNLAHSLTLCLFLSI